MTRNATCLTLAAVVMLTQSTPSFGAGEGLADYVVVSWTERDGLPSGDIRSIVQDREGYLWLGTSEGLYRFDGVRFLAWDALSETPLPERRVLSLLSSTDGSLWVAWGGSGGVSRIRNRDLKHYDEQQGIGEGFIRSLAEDRQGVIWAGGRSGLYKFADSVWEKVEPSWGLPEGPTYHVYQDRYENLWVSARSGLFLRSSKEEFFRKIEEGSEFPRGFSEDKTGSLWVTDPLVGFRKVGGRNPVRHQPHSVRQGNGFGLMHDRRGNLWVATSGDGLWRVTSREDTFKIQVISAQNGLSDDSVRSLLEDREGNIWVGTQGGLHRFSVRTVTALTGLGLVRAVEVAHDGSAWVGTSSGLIRIRQGLAQRKDLSGKVVTALHQDANGALWVGTNQGLLRFASGQFSRVVPPQGVTLRTVASISTGPDGSVWLCDREEGLFRWRNGNLTAVDVPFELRRRTPYAVHVGSGGLVWTAFSGGVLSSVDSQGRFALYKLPSGLTGALRAIYEDGQTIWIAGDDGLTRFAGRQFVTAGQRNGLPRNAVSAVVKDAEGYLWAGVGSGIIRLHSKEFEALALDPSYRIRYGIRDASDGVGGDSFWRGNPSAVRSDDGRLWFVTTAGVTVVDPRVLYGNRAAPRARIEAVIIRERRSDIAQHAILPPRTENLQIEYTTLGVASPTKVNFRYRLEGGSDTDWIDAGSRRQATFTNLDPGQYRFRVVATTTEGVWHQSDDIWEFSIRPVYYQTSWFYAACTTALFLLVGAAWQLRLRQVRHEFSVVLAERVRLSREIHDTLLQNLVALALHFESLARKLNVSSPALKEDVTRIRREIEDYVRETRQSVWALRAPDQVRFDLPTMLKRTGERCTAGSSVRFDFTFNGAPREWPHRVEQQLLRIGQEAIHNSVRHANASYVRVWLEDKDQELCLRVSDDGCGFDLTGEQLEDHCGLRGMRERAAQVGGQLRIVAERGKGTEIEVAVPLSPSH